jgi:leucyl aminopeptidase
LFLQEFVDGVPWAHLDIAGPAFLSSDDGYFAKGGTGFGVRTLVELARTFVPPEANAKNTEPKGTPVKRAAVKRAAVKRAAVKRTRRPR